MRRSITLALVATVLVSLLAVPAAASPLSQKRAEAESARAQVSELDTQVEIASEDYNEAKSAYDQVTAEVAETEARLEQLRAEIGTRETSLGTRAQHMYRTGPLGMLEVVLGASDFQEFTTLWETMVSMSEDDADNVIELKTARTEAEAAEAQLTAQQTEAKAHLDTMAAKKSEIEARLADRQAALAGIEAEVAQLEAEERAAAAAQARSAAARAGSASSSSRGSTSGGNPSRAPASGVVGIAKQYLGTPYRWGASGPNAFDCSGFTMYVYRQVGVSLPHSSRAQYNSGPKVSRANLQPGDLVFFGRSRIHHVGIYVGGGSYIHAPHSGAVVRIDPLNRSDYAGACRP
jgi:cell wall-associated NlpC family hydrolase